MNSEIQTQLAELKAAQNHVKADKLYSGYYELVDIYEKVIKENESEI